MLKERILTALVLLAILLPALFWPDTGLPFAAVALVLIAAGAWEWGRLNALSSTPALACAVVCALGCAGCYVLVGGSFAKANGLWLGASAFWVAAGAWLLLRGVSGWSSIATSLRVVGGVLMLVVAWCAVVALHQRGVWFLLSALALVWIADVAAYFGGKGLSPKFPAKLAPSVSPGKTRVGAISGLLGVLAVAAVIAGLPDARAATIVGALGQKGVVLATGALVLLVAMSIVGDLVESLVKRSAGAKDSSGLLPGHGGVLDRIDALLPTMPMVLWLAHAMKA